MTEPMLTYLLFGAGLLLLVVGASLLVDGAASIARRLRVPDILIGLTVVAIGTSMPELFVNLLAIYRNTPDLAIGNVIGSNISNILLILGLTAMISPIRVSRDTVWKQVPFSLLAALALLVLANDRLLDNAPASLLGRGDGLLLLLFLVIFLYYLGAAAQRERASHQGSEKLPDRGVGLGLLLVLLGLAGLVFGSGWVVDGAVLFATVLGMDEKTIGLTIVAVGTSLPELVTALVAAFKHKVDMAVGNVIGSNILNVFMILGIGATVSPLPFRPDMNLDMLVMTGASLFVFLFMFTGGRSILDRWEGVALLLSYVVYVGYLVLQTGTLL